jgi:hypothetical protein
VIGAELLHGATAGVVLPGIAAITLGIVGRQNMSLRIGRNYRYGAAGLCVATRDIHRDRDSLHSSSSRTQPD